eukprot:6484101-Amphidinium_carterae.1
MNCSTVNWIHWQEHYPNSTKSTSHVIHGDTLPPRGKARTDGMKPICASTAETRTPCLCACYSGHGHVTCNVDSMGIFFVKSLWIKLLA